MTALVPARYERFVAIMTPNVARMRMANAQRFHAVEESAELAEADRRPLIQAALERHQAVEVDDDRRLRQVVQRHRREPEHHVPGAELGRGADPTRADDEHDLREDERRKAELLSEFRRVLLDVPHAIARGAHADRLPVGVARPYGAVPSGSSTFRPSAARDG